MTPRSARIFDPVKAPASSRVWTSVAALLLAYVGVTMWLGRLPVTDEAYFKAAGCQWAQTGQFGAPEMTGFHLVKDAELPIEQVFAAYPPGYPFLFGAFTRTVGFGWNQCILYDALIHALLVIAVLIWASRVDDRFSGPLALLVAVVLLLRSTPGRPDELAMAFGMLGLSCLVQNERRILNAVLAGVAFGLMAGTSPGGAIALGICAAPVLFTRTGSWREHLGVAALAGAVGAGTFGLVILPLLLQDVRVIDQFLTFAQSVKRYENETWLAHWAFSWRYGKSLIILTLACFAVALVGLASRQRILSWREWLSLWIGPLVAVIYLMNTLPGKYTYLWFTAPMLIVASLLVIARLRSRQPRTAFILGTALAAAVGFASLGTVKNVLVMASLDETQTSSFNSRELQKVIPDGSTVLAGDAWGMVRDRCKVYAAYEFSTPELDTIDFVVLSGNGSGKPGTVVIPGDFRDYIESHFALVHDNLPRRALEFWGRRLTNSAYGFGTYVMARKEDLDKARVDDTLNLEGSP